MPQYASSTKRRERPVATQAWPSPDADAARLDVILRALPSEIGLRVALGAPRGQHFEAGAGAMNCGFQWRCILAGAIGNLALGKAISTLLYNVEPTDPLTIGAEILLSLVTVMACYFPVRRALRIDPMIALKSE